MIGKHQKQHTKIRRVAALSTLAVTGGVCMPVLAGSAHAATVAQWDCIAKWESGGRWNLPYGDATSTGGLQIQTPTWLDYGGAQYAPEAYLATKAQQIAIAERILRGQGAKAWTTSYHCDLTLGGAPAASAPVRHAAPKPSAKTKTASAPVVKGERYTVKEGDCLWTIALDHYGAGEKWTSIYAANRSTVGPNPDLILPGQILVLP